MKLFFLFIDALSIPLYGFFAALIIVAILKEGIAISVISLTICWAYLLSTRIKHFGRGWVEPLRSEL